MKHEDGQNAINTVTDELSNRDIYEYDDNDKVGREYNETRHPNFKVLSEDKILEALY